MKKLTPIIIALLLSCNQKEINNFDWQGHRGCRGLMPENSIEGFIYSLNFPIKTIELDVVITKDKKVICSHEAFISSEICLTDSFQNSEKLNIYQLNYEDVKKIDCGSKVNPRFPNQKKIKSHKPLLANAIDSVEKHIKLKNLNPIFYNIETKITPDRDDIFHPKPEEFCQLILDVLKQKNIIDRCIIQSFDNRTLQYLHKIGFEGKLALLIEDSTKSWKQHIELLGFKPHIYSPYFKLLNKEIIKSIQSENILVIPWTVNEKTEMDNLKNWNVDGIITDYPNLIEKP